MYKYNYSGDTNLYKYNFGGYNMTKSNKLIVTFLIATSILIGFNSINVYANDTSHKVLYTTDCFSVQEQHINFIINSISTSADNIIVDAYLLNLDKLNFKEIKDFHLNITDAKNSKILDEVFLDLQLIEPLKGQSGKRIVLTAPLKNKNIEKKDFSRINYNFSYNYVTA